MKRIAVIALIIGVVLSPFIASSAACSAGKNSIGSIMNLLGNTRRSNIIDFILSDQEGLFREPCHKARIIEYIYDEDVAGREIAFDKRNLKFYVGLHMERKFMDLDYQERVRPYAIRLATLTYDDRLMKDAENWYQGDPESLSFLSMVHYK